MMGFYKELISQHEMLGLVERAFRGERRNAFFVRHNLKNQRKDLSWGMAMNGHRQIILKKKGQ